MSEPSPDELAEIRTLARVNNFLPDIREVVDKKVAQITSRIMQKINTAELTPDEAFSAWHEVAAYRKMLKTFDVKTRLAPQLASKEI